MDAPSTKKRHALRVLARPPRSTWSAAYPGAPRGHVLLPTSDMRGSCRNDQRQWAKLHQTNLLLRATVLLATTLVVGGGVAELELPPALEGSSRPPPGRNVPSWRLCLSKGRNMLQLPVLPLAAINRSSTHSCRSARSRCRPWEVLSRRARNAPHFAPAEKGRVESAATCGVRLQSFGPIARVSFGGYLGAVVRM